MANKKARETKPSDDTDRITELLQDLFILQALQAGMKGEDIRKILHVDQWRVTNISKAIKKPSTNRSGNE